MDILEIGVREIEPTVANIQTPDYSGKSSVSVESKMDILLGILIFLVIGCFCMVAKFIFDLDKTYKLVRRSVTPVSEQIANIVTKLSNQYKMSRPIRILKSSLVNVPVVVGWLRPVILLPIAVTIGLEKNQLELIIAHEIAHIKRMDFAVNVTQSVVEICFFYHPVVHWINRIIREEREYICDSMALSVLGNDEQAKLSLAKALLNTEELREGNFSLIAVAASGGKLKNRISNILDGEYRTATSIRTVFVGVMAFALSLAAMASTFNLDNSTRIDDSSLSKVSNGVFPAVNQEVPFYVKPQPSMTSSGTASPETTNLKKSVSTNYLRSEVDSLKMTSPSIETETVLTSKLIVPPKLEIASNSPSLDSRSKQEVNISSRKGPTKTMSKIEADKPLAKSKSLNSKINREVGGGTDPLIEKSVDSSKDKVAKRIRTASLDLASVKSYSDPKAIFTPYPKYPKRAWNKMISQTVKVEFVINSEGMVGDIKTTGKVERDFAREIRRNLRKWRYEPAIKDGQKVNHLTSLEFVFRAPQENKITPITTGSRIRRF